MKSEKLGMKFTGERFVPSEQGQIRLEHYHRYACALALVKGKRVLDLACGEGYGASLLASYADVVVGADIDAEAIEHASSAYSQNNLTFCQADACSLPFSSGSFDVVVSFETLEHLSQQNEMISEIRRVLTDQGLLLISTPNGPIYREESGQDNPFHEKELNFSEFDSLLKAAFENVGYYGQRLVMLSAIQQLCEQPASLELWSDDGSCLVNRGTSLSDPTYFIALCGRSKASLPTLTASGLAPSTLDLVKHYVGFAKWAKAQDHQTQVQRMLLQERTAELEQLKKETESLKHHLEEIKVIRDDHEGMLLDLSRSFVWRSAGLLSKAGAQLLYVARAARKSLRSRFEKDIDRSDLTKVMSFPEVARLANTRQIVIHSSEKPTASVIIPVYGKVEYTLRCLASIALNPPSIPYEVIVVDDCSPDDSVEILSRVVGIKLLRSERNGGFIRACNLGAQHASGEFLHFLNNDTEVSLSWLDELIATFDELPGTGLVGSKLVYPDGRLQEAGGIIWKDGSAWNYGNLQDPRLPEFNYAREVDYCSGASIAVTRSLFEELGGFDEHYCPAYCEDSDLALKVRDRGLRVIYQPLSQVIHYEGVTSGTDTSTGTKRYQVENSQKLFERWRSRLEHYQVNGQNVERAKDRMATHRALVLDHCTPTPDQDAGSVTALNLMLLLREMGFQVTFIPEDNFAWLPNYTPSLQRAGIEALYAPSVTTVEQHLKAFGSRYDLVLLFRPGVVQRHLPSIRKYAPDAKVLYHTVDLHHLRMQREAELIGGALASPDIGAMKKIEFESLEAVDASIVHSTAEYDILAPSLPNCKIHVFPLVLNVKNKGGDFGSRKDVMFVGGYQHTPNVDAVNFFVAEVMPLLRNLIPGVCFHIVGSNPPQDVVRLAAEDVIVHGYIADLGAFMAQTRISVAPLRYGAGIKGKIGTAMAAGLPVVATPLAGEGMGLDDGENVIVAEDPHEFAKAVAGIYNDPDLWSKIRANALRYADKQWGAEAAFNIFSAILRDLEFDIQRRPHPLSLFEQS